MSAIDLSVASTSRAINIAADRAHVIATCRTKNTPISAIEDLPSGGTRVVLMNGDDAAIVRRAYGKKVIVGSVARTPFARA